MCRLNQINHWNKPTHYKKQIKQKNIFEILVNYFFMSIIYKSLVLKFLQKEELNETGI